MSPSPRLPLLLPLCLATLLALTGLMSASRHLLSPAALLALYAALFLPYLGVLSLLRGAQRERVGRAAVWWIVGAALLVRLILVGTPPTFSDDLYRYVWDGRVALSGINPFLHAPDAPALAPLRDAQVWPLINHKQIPTIYPPVAQALFLLNAWLGGGPTLLKLLLVGVEASFLWAVFVTLRRQQRLSRTSLPLALYLLNPTVFIELAWSGHIDVLAFGALALALLWSQDASARMRLGSGVMLGLSAAAKLLPIITLPLLLFAPRHERPWRALLLERAAIAALCLGVLVSSYLPYQQAGTKLFSGFGAYATTWRGNDGAFRALSHLSEQSVRAWSPPGRHADAHDPDSKAFVSVHQLDDLFLARGWTKEWQGETIPDTTFGDDQVSQSVAKLVVAGLMALTLLWALLVTRDPKLGALLLLTVLFFFAPTVYPWYVAWLVPLAALQRRLPRSAIVFSFTTLTAYLAWVSSSHGGPWEVPAWVVTLTALLVLSVAVWDYFNFFNRMEGKG